MGASVAARNAMLDALTLDRVRLHSGDPGAAGTSNTIAAAGLARTAPIAAAIQEQQEAARPAAASAAPLDLERARIAAKVRQQRELEEIVTVLMMAA